MKRRSAVVMILLATHAFAASARPAGTHCKGPHRRVYGHGGVLGPSYLPPPLPSQGALPVPTLPEPRYTPGVAPPSPFLPNDLPPTYLPQKL